MTSIETTAFQGLEANGRLVKPQHKGATSVAGRFGFRGELALTGEPEVTMTSVFATAEDGEKTLSFLAGQLPSFKDLPALVATLGDVANPDGKYFIFVGDLDRASRYRVSFEGGSSLSVLPFDDASIYNELIDFLYLDKMKMKKFDTGQKLDAICDGAAKFDKEYEAITYEVGLTRL